MGGASCSDAAAMAVGSTSVAMRLLHSVGRVPGLTCTSDPEGDHGYLDAVACRGLGACVVTAEAA